VSIVTTAGQPLMHLPGLGDQYVLVICLGFLKQNFMLSVKKEKGRGKEEISPLYLLNLVQSTVDN
jgi:hypothetical protein